MEGKPETTIRLGICAMDKKVKARPMKQILKNLINYGEFTVITIEEQIFMNEEPENWPVVDCLITFYSVGFPYSKMEKYIQRVKPFLINDFGK